MSSSAITADERVLDLSFTDDALSVSLRDGRVISVLLVWFRACSTPRPPSVRTGKLPADGTAFFGPTSTKTSAPLACAWRARASAGTNFTRNAVDKPPERANALYGYEPDIWERAKSEAIAEISAQSHDHLLRSHEKNP